MFYASLGMSLTLEFMSVNILLEIGVLRWRRGEHSIMAFLSVLFSQERMSPKKTLAREALIRGFI